MPADDGYSVNSSTRAMDNSIIFCKKPWQIAAGVLLTAMLLLFGWGLYLYDLDFDLESYEAEEYAVSNFFSSLSADTMPQSSIPGGLNVAAARTPEWLAQVATAVVSIHRRGGGMVASGVIVHPDGYVVTTLHSSANPDQLEIHIGDANGGSYYKTDIVKKHQAHDLVLLKIVTNDRFLYLKLAETETLPLHSPLTAVGKNGQGAVVANPGVLQLSDQVRQVGGNSITHLMQTNALVHWEQGGGAIINRRGELVGVGLMLQGDQGGAEGFVVPAHVINAHFQDVINFSVPAPADQPQTQTQIRPSPPQSQPQPKGLAAAWWDQARHQARQDKLATAQQMQQQQQQLNPGSLLAQNVAAIQAVESPQGRVSHIGAPGDSVSLMDLEHNSSFDLGYYKLDAIIGLVLLGLVAGAVGTLVPMGGGIVAVSGMMLVFGYGAYMVRPVLYITNLFTYGLAALRQWIAGEVVTRRVRDLLPGTIVGAVIGYFLGHNLYDHVLGYLLGVFALVMAAVVLYELRGGIEDHDSLIRPSAKKQQDRIDNFLSDSAEVRQRSWATLPVMGAPLGVLTGLLGVSGGVVEQFFQRKYTGLSAENARANAIVMVFWASLTATIVSLGYGVSVGSFQWQTPLTLAMILVPSTYGGGFLGHYLEKRISVDQKRWLFVVIMGLVAFSLLLLQ